MNVPGEVDLEAQSEARLHDPVASLMDSQADAGDEDADYETYLLDRVEAREAGVDLDAIPDERPLD